MKLRYPIAALVVAGAIALCGYLQPPLPIDNAQWSSRFDSDFKKYAKRYFGAGFDWRWFKAQGAAESTLEPLAVSHRGARGVMQILPSTYREIWSDIAARPAIEEARWNIGSGIAYERQLYERWRGRVVEEDRFKFALASYNAGFRGILDARARARAQGRDPTVWSHVAPHAPAETRHYVRRILTLMTPETSDG